MSRVADLHPDVVMERSIAIIAGGGGLPALVCAAAERSSRFPVVFAIAGEADAKAFGAATVHIVRWGEIGRLFQLLDQSRCRDVVFVGSIARRPDYTSLMPDFGAVKLIPRILQLMRASDGNLLDGVVRIFEERGLRVVSPLEIAPDLALPAGCVAGTLPRGIERDIVAGAAAARKVGARDLAQGAVAFEGQVVATEDASGTDALLERVSLLRRSGALPKSGGVLVKCLKPSQDGRHDLPTIGPATADFAARARLAGVAAEAGRAMLVGRDETIDAFNRAGLFLYGLEARPLAGR